MPLEPIPLEPIADLDVFRQALRDALAKRGMSLDEVAVAVGLKRGSSVSDYKRGDVEKLQPARVFALEKVLGCDPGELSTNLGYLPLSAAGTVVAAILASRDLSPDSRRVLLHLYRQLRSENPGRTECPEGVPEEGDLEAEAPTGRTP